MQKDMFNADFNAVEKCLKRIFTSGEKYWREKQTVRKKSNTWWKLIPHSTNNKVMVNLIYSKKQTFLKVAQDLANIIRPPQRAVFHR